MQTMDASAGDWRDLVGADTIETIKVAMKENPAFLAAGAVDLNKAIHEYMNIEIATPLVLWTEGEAFYVAPKSNLNGSDHGNSDGELTDADLDLVSAGMSMSFCSAPPPKACDSTDAG